MWDNDISKTYPVVQLQSKSIWSWWPFLHIRKREACKNTLSTTKYEKLTAWCCGSGWGFWYRRSCCKSQNSKITTCGYIDATSPDISKEVATWLQMGSNPEYITKLVDLRKESEWIDNHKMHRPIWKAMWPTNLTDSTLVVLSTVWLFIFLYLYSFGHLATVNLMQLTPWVESHMAQLTNHHLLLNVWSIAQEQFILSPTCCCTLLLSWLKVGCFTFRCTSLTSMRNWAILLD